MPRSKRTSPASWGGIRRYLSRTPSAWRVEVSDHTAKLYGHVHSLNEANAATAAAAAAPGVATVESHLLVSP
jgi:osmotically-inducible protein OsmY